MPAESRYCSVKLRHCIGQPHRRQLGTILELRTRADAEKAAELLRKMLVKPIKVVPIVRRLVEQFRREKMPQRHSTRLEYESWLKNYIIPRWGDCPLTDLQARPVELWLQAQPIAPKSKVHIRGLVRTLWDYAMWRGDVPTERNPMELVRISGATKRGKKLRSLTVDEFQQFLAQLDGAFRTMASVCISFGLRISEYLGLKWSDVDWLSSMLTVERGIVRQIVGDGERNRRDPIGSHREVLRIPPKHLRGACGGGASTGRNATIPAECHDDEVA